MGVYNVTHFDEALKVMKDAGTEPITGPDANHPALARELAYELISRMTLEEKAYMLGGHWFIDESNIEEVLHDYKAIPGGGCERLGVPPFLFSDGPRGVVMGNATCFPTCNVRAAAFDESLEEAAGEVIAKECIALGASFFAGVCINLLRHPSWGRAQEAYGEDQYLTGKYGAALVRGLQKYGVIACPKHYYMNSIENLRFSVSADADEETQRDVYLYHFEECFKAGAGSVMSAYNKVNGIYCGENKEIYDLLKELGFEGFSVSDFVWGIHDGAESLKAGLDVEMPFAEKRGDHLAEAVREGILEESLLDEHCANIIATMLRFQNIYREQHFTKDIVAGKDHTELAEKIMEKGTVLLKNNGILPLRNTDSRIVVGGRFADDPITGDRGSSMVRPPYVVTPYEGLSKVYHDTVLLGDDPAAYGDRISGASAIIVVAGNDYRDEGEFMADVEDPEKALGGDRKSLRIHSEDKELVHALKQYGKPVIVILYSGSALLIDEWENEADAVIYAGYPGMEGGHALAAIVSGKVNPSGKLPFTVAQTEEDYPYFPYSYDKNQNVEYGYYHGYALFDKEAKKAAYPFGYGLSYTEFEYHDAAAQNLGDALSVSCCIRNAGDCAGEETMLVFVGSGMEGKPHKLLKGFKRVSLEPGEDKECTVLIPKQDLRLFSVQEGKMIIPEHATVYIGRNAEEAEKICLRVY